MCINIAVGREASTDNQIMVSRNEECSHHNWYRYLAYRNAPEYADERCVHDSLWTLGNGLQVAVPENRFAYSAMPDAIMHGNTQRFLHEGRGINENNVAVSTLKARPMNPSASAADPLLGRGGIAEAVIPTLLLPQALTARHGVELLGQYLRRHGASEACALLIADPHEAWYLEIGSAHHWIALRIPADACLVAASGMRIHGIDLGDAGVLHSPGLFEFVVQHRLLVRPERQSLDFAAAFGMPPSPHDSRRIRLTQQQLCPSQRQAPPRPQPPLFIQVDTRLCVTEVMAALRETGQWTVFEGGTGRPSVHDRTAASHIICLSADMPPELQGLIWQTLGSPQGAPYLPLYQAMQEIPDELGMNAERHGGSSAYWAFRGLRALADSDNPGLLAKLQAMWRTQEQEFVFQQHHLKQMLLGMYQQSPQSALAFAQHYSTGCVLQMVEKAYRERTRLMAEIADRTGTP